MTLPLVVVNRGAQKDLPIVAALLLICLAYLVAAPSLGWLSDDYTLVFGSALHPWPTLGEALRRGGEGTLSTHRLLCYPFIGYIGGWLGAPGAHVLQAGLHLLCAWIFYLLLRRLHWVATAAALATAGFGVVPWVSQPVFWWSAVCTIVSSIFVLLAAHAYVTWSRSHYRRLSPLLACFACVFASLLFYELWLAGFVMFWAIEVYLQRIERPAETRSWPRSIVVAPKRCWPLLIPYSVWVVMFALSYHGSVHRPHLAAERALIVFLSVQLRAYHWFANTPWLSGLRSGIEPLMSISGVVVTGLLAAIGWLVMHPEATIAHASGGPSRALVFARVPLSEMLFLAWAVFLASRLVFILQGGIALETRHNYGAAMGAAMGGAALVTWFQTIQPSTAMRTALGLLLALVLLTCTITTAGIGVQYHQTAIFEEQTYQLLADALPQVPQSSTIVIVGEPMPNDGEMRYFGESSGFWLENRLHALRPDVHAYVVASVDFDGRNVGIVVDRVPLGDRMVLRLPNEEADVFFWRGSHLVGASSPQTRPSLR